MLKRVLTFLLFLVVVITIYFSMNYYVYRSIIRGIALSPIIEVGLSIIFLLGFLTFIVSQALKRKYHVYLLSYMGHLWLGILAIAFFIFILRDIIIIIFSDRMTLSTYIALLLIFFFSAVAIAKALKGPIVKEVIVPIQSLAKELNGFTIVQLSDVHLGMFTSKGWVEKLVKQVNKIDGDLVVITGDLVDDKSERVKPFSSIMKKLQTKYGTFAVAGNHELYTGMETFYTFAKESNIKVLKDEKVDIGAHLEIIGLEDNMIKKHNGKTEVYEEILPKPDADKLTVLLSHQPTNFEKAVKYGVDLQLSGHTHAGQIPPMNFIVSLYYKYAYGLYKYKSSYIYTTSGTGTWGPPMRLFSSSEIVKLKLVLKNNL